MADELEVLTQTGRKGPRWTAQELLILTVGSTIAGAFLLIVLTVNVSILSPAQSEDMDVALVDKVLVPVAGAGGTGIASSVTGSSVSRGGGGGGGSFGATGGAGGTGGGGTGASSGGGGSAGSANTGGGGGGGSGTSGAFNGGSGVVFIKYPTTELDLIIGTGLTIDNGSGGNVTGDGTRKTPSFTVGGYKVYMVKSGTGTVTF